VSLQRSPDSIVVFEGAYFYGEGREGKESGNKWERGGMKRD